MKIIFFSTSWSTTNGGVNSFNFDLCNTIGARGVEVYCLTPPNQSPDLQIEHQNSVKVYQIGHGFDQLHKSLDEIKRLAAITGNEKIVWVGHDALTGGAAILSKSHFGGTSVVFHHMDYSNYYHLKSEKTSSKISIQKSVIKEADLVFAVGPRLLINAKRLRKPNQETYELTPGAPNYSSISFNRRFDYRIAICGRLDEENDPIKNITPAIKSAHRLLVGQIENIGAINLIGTSADGTSIHSKLGLSKNVAINEISYISTRDNYFKELVDNDILLMPSLKEGFGLVAWEAASLGIPVIVSQSSGFYEHLKNNGLESLVVSIQMTGVIPVDEGTIQSSLFVMSRDYLNWLEKAKQLAQELKKTTWTDVGDRFISLLVPDAIVSAEAAITAPLKVKRVNRIRPNKEKDLTEGNFSRFEDLLSLTYKKRQVVISATEGRDFSRGSKIKFELWKVFAPREEYFLYIHPNTNIAKTVERLFSTMLEKNIEVDSLYVIRKDNGEANYISKLVGQMSSKIVVSEYPIKDYIWSFCIEESFKSKNTVKAPTHYIDQSLRYKSEGATLVNESSKTFLLGKLLDKPKCAAHLVVAPGGMGKTWLCMSLAEGINLAADNKRLVVLITAETLRNYFANVGLNHIEIGSLYELYDVYTKACKSEQSYDRDTFELSVLSGNITVLIDGLDELASVLQERFDLHSFLESIYELSSGLNSSQILLTTRDNFQLDEINITDFDIERYELLGFSNVDWSRYATKRFRDNPKKIHLTNKLLKLLSQSELQDSDGRVIPFFLDVVCSILEEDENKGESDSFNLDLSQTDYPTNNLVTDNIIYSVFRREIRRQSIGIGISELVSLISEIVSENGDAIDKSTFKHQLDLYFDTRSDEILKKILLNPLFKCDENHIYLKYSFLSSYFRSLYIINTIINGQFTSESLNALAKANANDSPEIDYVRKFFSGKRDDLEIYISRLMPKLREVLRQSKEAEIKKSEIARRAISGLLKIYTLSKGYSGSQISERILDIFSGGTHTHKSIDGLNIYGDFPALDFSGATILNSKFLDYKNFSRSKFKESKFLYCIFDACANESSLDSSILQANFDSSCAIGDLSKLIDQAKSKESLSARLIEDDSYSFLGCFISSGNVYDPKLSWIKFSNRVNGLKAKSFTSLMPKYIKVKTVKSSEKYYSLADSFVDSARRFVDNNFKDEQFKGFLEFVSK
jgi:glycosyltransferase involved in cell wall biosynthesis/arginine repressor